MSTLRILRKVNKFPAKNQSFFDSFAWEALNEVSGPSGKQFLSTVRSSWHRPSGDVKTLTENLMNYGKPRPKRCFDGDYLAILKKTMDELKPANPIIPLTLGAAAKHPDLPRSTSPGFPWIHQGYANKGEVISDPVAMGKIHRAWDSIGRGLDWSLPDSMAFHRVVASPVEKTKIRPVWGYPTDVVLEEARYFLPLMSFLKTHCNEYDTFYGLGMETALSGHNHLARNFDTPVVNVVLNTDYSNFDALVPQWIIRDVFAHISSWFDFTKVIDSEGKIWNVNPDQTCRRWKAMVSYFVKTKIRLPSGERFQKFNGVPSGSYFTNLIDTCVNATQTRTALRRVYGALPIKDYYYGDDSTIFLNESFDLDEFSRVLLDTFGAVLSIDKTLLSDNPDNIHWLGYYHRPTGPVRDFGFIAASTLFPDREVTSPIESAARLLGQLYSSMDPKISVVFYDAILFLSKAYTFTIPELEALVSSMPAKAFKYLTTIGLGMDEIRLPAISNDPIIGGRLITAVMPKPCARNFFRFRDVHLPRYAFVPEAYMNWNLRTHEYFDFDKYVETFTNVYSFDRDEEFFDDNISF